MQKDQFILIAKKILEGTASLSEQELYLFHINTYVQQNPEWEKFTVKAQQQIQADILADIRRQISSRKTVIEKSSFPLWQKFALAAAAAVVVLSGIWFFNTAYRDKRQPEFVSGSQDIKPGKNSATLTLANGQKILINEAVAGNISSQSGVKISKTKNGQIVYEVIQNNSGKLEYNTLSTTRGEQTQVRLPDGSLVFLNAASSLKYPTNFATTSSRRVYLTGEGYFEVSKDKEHPFIVESGNQQVEVLGTHFNINSYADEPGVKTTLLEGQVKVTPQKEMPGNTAARSVDWKILMPGDQALFQNERFTVRKVDIAEAVAWKNGEFLFNEDDFHSVMRKLSRWYDVEIVYDVSAPQNFKLGGFISRNKNISAVLKLIELTGDVHFIVEGRRITVTK